MNTQVKLAFSTPRHIGFERSYPKQAVDVFRLGTTSTAAEVSGMAHRDTAAAHSLAMRRLKLIYSGNNLHTLTNKLKDNDL